MVLASSYVDSKAKRKSHKLSMEAVEVERLHTSQVHRNRDRKFLYQSSSTIHHEKN